MKRPVYRTHGTGHFMTPDGAAKMNEMLDKTKKKTQVHDSLARWSNAIKTMSSGVIDARPAVSSATGQGDTAPIPQDRATFEQHMNGANLLATRWKLTGDRTDLEAVRRLLLAWAATLATTGSALHEHGIIAAATAYFKVRDSLPCADRATIDRWLRSFQQAHHDWLMTKPSTDSTATRQRHYSNIVTWSLATQATLVAVLDDDDTKLSLISDVTQHLSGHFASDGSTFDFVKRDAVSYVSYDLIGLVHLGHAMSYIMSEDYFSKSFRDYEAPKQNGEHPVLTFKVDDKLAGTTIFSVARFLEMQAAKTDRHIEFAGTTYERDKSRGDYLKPWNAGDWYRAISTASYAWTKYDTKVTTDNPYGSNVENLLGAWRDYLTPNA